MIHYIKGSIILKDEKTLIVNEHYGIEAEYRGSRQINAEASDFFCFPYIDDTQKTIKYFCFDCHEQKKIFENMIKISGIGPKTAFGLAHLDQQKIKQALNDSDIKFFQSIQGIGPKTAKRIFVELKEKFKPHDLNVIDQKNALIKNIIKSLSQRGYNKQDIIQKLSSYPNTITKQNVQDCITRLTKQLSQQ